MDVRNEGVFAGPNVAGGLFRSMLDVNTNNPNYRIPGSPLDALARREHAVLWHDFIENDDDQWVGTAITAGTASVLTGTANGVLRLTHGTINQGFGSYQFSNDTVSNAEDFLVAAADRIICYEARVAISDVDDCDWFIGFGERDTTFVDAAGALLANGADNHAGFHHVLADAGVPTMSSAGTALANVDSTQLGSGINRINGTVSATVADATYHKYGIRVEGTSSVEFYFDDKLVHTRTGTAAFDTAMTPTFALVDNGNTTTLDIDYVLVTQTR